MGTCITVSLFTREWIEISDRITDLAFLIQSPSLRGSGLKSVRRVTCQKSAVVSLFTREWIEILRSASLLPEIRSPSLRGSGLKSD